MIDRNHRDITGDNQVWHYKCTDYNIERIRLIVSDHLVGVVYPGDHVIIKPNWVRESHQYKENEWLSVVTHPSIITATLIAVLECLEGTGIVSIVDSPETVSSFEKILSLYPVDEWRELAGRSGTKLEIIDLRDNEWTERDGIIIHRKELDGDPRGKIEIDYGNYSMFSHLAGGQRKYYGADYNIEEVNSAHRSSKHFYSLSATVLGGDVFINLPKLKTHKKAGITASLKNLVGINTFKNYLPHYSIGSPEDGGDQFATRTSKNILEARIYSNIKQYLLAHEWIARAARPVLSKVLKSKGKHEVRSGNWYGNDTLWRMVLDLNRIMLWYATDVHGNMVQRNQPRVCMNVVDAVVGGEGNGPKAPDPISLDSILIGRNPAAVDAVCAGLMGYDYKLIPTIKYAFEEHAMRIASYDCADVKVVGESFLCRVDEVFQMCGKKARPHYGWEGHIEIT